MTDIFISYAKEDRSRAESLSKALEEQGWSVWWDRTIPPGKTFDQVIEEAITTARCVVVLWSEGSIKSDWVKEEANIAKELEILVPVKIDPVELPLGFGRIQAADLTNWETEPNHPGFLSLRNAISEFAGPPLERDKNAQNTKLPESNLEQKLEVRTKEGETFQPAPSHHKPVEKESPIADPKAPRKKRLAFGIGAVALIIVLSVIGWKLFSKPASYTIKASSNSNGSISPSGLVPVPRGGDKIFSIKPDPDYVIADVKVNGKSVGFQSIYTFVNVTGDGKIEASFGKLGKYGNIARVKGAVATQSSTSHEFSGPEKAIDGITDGNFGNKSVTHTRDEDDSCWQLELPSPAMIKEIVIWNRTDCCDDRLSNVRVSVLDKSKKNKVWTEYIYKLEKEDEKFKTCKLDPPVRGMFVEVKIQGRSKAKQGDGVLSLAEVQVFGRIIGR